MHMNKNIKFNIEQATMAQSRSTGINLLFLYLGTGWEWVTKSTPGPFYPRERA
jgi:hypothetical protein